MIDKLENWPYIGPATGRTAAHPGAAAETSARQPERCLVSMPTMIRVRGSA